LNCIFAGLPACLYSRSNLGERHPRVNQESLAGRGEFDASNASRHERGSNLVFQIPNLAAE
jgi:hypothetical protein